MGLLGDAGGVGGGIKPSIGFRVYMAARISLRLSQQGGGSCGGEIELVDAGGAVPLWTEDRG